MKKGGRANGQDQRGSYSERYGASSSTKTFLEERHVTMWMQLGKGWMFYSEEGLVLGT